MPKKLKDYTLEELKSLAYDIIRQKQQVDANLQAVNQLIAEKENTKDKSKDDGKKQ